MPFTRETAAALRERIFAGLSEIDPDGNERAVPAKRQRTAAALAAKSPPPSVDELFERYKGSDTEGGDPEQYAARLRALVGKRRGFTNTGDPEPLDLSPLMKFIREPVTDIGGEVFMRPASAARVEHPARAILAGSRVPARFDALICSDAVRDTVQVQDVRAWLASGKWAITLACAKGTGKTVAACVGLVEAGGGLYVTAEEIAAPMGRELAELAEAAPYLVLDDLGDEVLTDLGTLRIRQLLTNRHAAGRRTCLTSNANAVAFAERYGARVFDRLREGYAFREYGGASLRGAR